MSFVLDASVTLLWFAPQTNSQGVGYAQRVLIAMKTGQAMVPGIWGLEVANVIARLQSRAVVTEAETQRFLGLLSRLDIAPDPATAIHALGQTLDLARRYKLSAYDAAYLQLALRTGLPLATLDNELGRAANHAGVKVFAGNPV